MNRGLNELSFKNSAMKSKCAAVMVVTMVLAIAFAFARLTGNPASAQRRSYPQTENPNPVRQNIFQNSCYAFRILF
jgi:hypothetical protein